MPNNWLPKIIIILTSISWAVAMFVPQQHLLLAATPVPEPLAKSLAGVVWDGQGPVAGAIVRVQATDNSTTTAEDGSFTLGDLVITRPITVTAWAKGYYMGWSHASPDQSLITITLTAHPSGDNLNYAWEPAANCGECHTAYADWQTDAHAQAAVNPRFLTMYTGTDIHGNKNTLIPRDNLGKPLPPDLSQPYYGPGFKLDYPDRAGNCAACHTPLAARLEPDNTCGWSGCHSSTTAALSEQVPEGVSPLYLSGVAAEGITCEFCHKIGEVKLNPETHLPHPDQPGIISMRLYRPPEGQQLFFGTFDDVARPHDSYLPLLEESAFCAACHYGIFDGVAGDMTVADGEIIYNSYGEWLASPYSDPETGRSCQDCHMPAGGDSYFVFPEKGGLARDPQRIHSHRMPGAADQTLLQNAVTMTTTARLTGGQLQVEVSLTNDKTGHSVPTDSPLRHLILIVRATDALSNELQLDDGSRLPDWTGNYAGQPGRVYAQILEDEWTGESPTGAFWRPIRLVSDNRLAALATDVSRYAFAGPANGPATIEVRLIYRRAFQQLMAWKGWTDPDILMEDATITVESSE